MNKEKTMNQDDEYCTGQCGYGPHCSECMKEKQRKWDEYLFKKMRELESADDDAAKLDGRDRD
jgi:hypothetical protein